MEEKITEPTPGTSTDKVPKNRSALLIIGGVLLLAVIALVLLLLWWRFIQPAFVIDGHKYSKTTYYKMMDSAKQSGVGKTEATNLYIEAEKRRLAAQKLNIEPTPNQISIAKSNAFPDSIGKPATLWQSEIAYSNSVSAAITFATSGGYSGAYFRYPFAIHLEALPYQYREGQKPKPEGWRDPKVIESDRQYALSEAQKDHEKIKNGASSEEIIAQVRSNPRLGRLGSTNGSLVFTINQDGLYVLNKGITQNLSTSFDQNILQKENTVKLTDIKTGQIVLNDLQTRVDGYYYFLQIDKYQKANPTISKQFDDTVKNIKVEKNV